MYNKNKMKTLLQFLKREQRTVTLALISFIVLMLLGNLFQPILIALGLITGIASVTHLLRRFLLPYIDLKVFAQDAREGNVASALIFLSVILLNIVLVACMTLIVPHLN